MAVNEADTRAKPIYPARHVNGWTEDYIRPEELENPQVLNASDVKKASGHETLKILGELNKIIEEAKRRLFAA